MKRILRMFSALKAGALLAVPLLSAPLLSGCYVTVQASAFLEMQASAKEISKLLNNPETPEKTKDFLRRAEEIKLYGEMEFGLSRSKNYTTFVELDRPWVAVVVQAAPALSTESWLWSYPAVGKLPYRGFYKKEDAFKEAEKLKKQGLDVLVRQVNAFSTLGFFKDPLYSFMEDYSEYELANLILHEETHAAVFLKKYADFNEEFASFVGDTAALLYIDSKYGDSEAEQQRKNLADAASDQEQFRLDIQELANRLNTLYADKDLSDAEKLQDKPYIIEDFQSEFEKNYPVLYKTDNYRGFSSAVINNAYISLHLLYGKNRSSFADLYALYNGGLRAFVQDVTAAVKEADNPWDALAELERKKTAAQR